jgi:hypothetical protein
MFYPHIIRLRGPWQQESAQPGSPSAQSIQIWRRRFHKPTGLDPGEAVWLVAQSTTPLLRATLNGAIVDLRSSSDESAINLYDGEITLRLEANNELMLELCAPPISNVEKGDALPAEVRLEIRRA